MIDDKYPNDDALVPDALIARDAGVTLRTLATWDDDPQLNFPAAVRIRGRKYRRWGEYQRLGAPPRADADRERRLARDANAPARPGQV